MTAEHEPCPDCGLVPQGAFQSGGRWFVRCPALGCHNVTTGTTRKGEAVLTPERAFEIWDGWARRERLRELRRQQARERGEQAAPPMDAPPPEAPAGVAVAVERSACRLCGLPLQWMVGPDGRRLAFDLLPDGTIGQNHFETCRPYLERLAEQAKP